MTDAFTRNFGVLFTEISIERAARKCCRAAITWGGDALVFVDSERRCSAVMPNTVAARNALKNCSTGFIGQYRANSDGGCIKRVNAQIAEDIWHHLKENA